MPNTAYASRTVNLRALLVLLAGVGLLGGAVYATHRFQVRRNAAGLLAQADQAEREGERAQAADYVWEYLGLVPEDTEALARYALLIEQWALTPTAKGRMLSLCDTVLRRDSGRADVRRVAARLSLELGHFSSARQHLGDLLEKSPQDGPLLLLRGRCEAGARQYEKAAEYYARAVERVPGDLAAWREYAAVLSGGLKDPGRADAVVEEMVNHNPKSAPARVAAARHYQARLEPKKAEEHLRGALAGSATDEELLLLASQVASARGQADEARRHARRGLRLHPGSAALRLACSRLEAQAGNKAEALALLAPLRQKPPGPVGQRYELGSLLGELGEAAGAEEVLRKLGGPEGERSRMLLGSQLLLRKGEYGEARVLLERLRGTDVPAGLGWLVDLRLADCYARLDSPDQAAEASQRALRAAPGDRQARARLAAALQSSGKTAEAVALYRELAAGDPAHRLALARLLLAAQLGLPPKERDWAELTQVLAGIPAARQDDSPVVTLRAGMLLAQGKPGEARALAQKACDRAPRDVEPWLLLAALAAREGGRDKGLAVLDEAERRGGRRVEWALARVAQWAGAGEAGRKPLRALAAEVGRWPDDDRPRLSAALAASLDQLGEAREAEALWRETARRRPRDLASRLVLLERAAGGRRAAEAGALAAEVEQVEGPGGPAGCYARALTALAGARPGDTAALGAARGQLERAALLRPSWARVHTLRGDVEAGAGRREEAVRHYLTALDRGERRLGVWRLAGQLLFELRRYGEAVALLKRLPEGARMEGGLGQLSAALRLVDAAESEDPARRRKNALGVARKVVRAGSVNYRDHLWLGQVAALAGENQEAEQALRKARQLAPAEPAPWLALVALLARVDPGRARREVEGAEKALDPRHPLALTVCHELVGHTRQAKAFAARAQQDRPDDPAVLAELAAFHARNGGAAVAEELWRQAIRLAGPRAAPGAGGRPELVRAGRRALALLLAGKRSFPALKEGLAVIEQNLEKGNRAEDREVKAILLSAQPARRGEAIRLFEGLSPLAPTTPARVQLRLAWLYEAEGKPLQAAACLQALGQGQDRTPAQVGEAVRGLLRLGEGEDARRLLLKLKAAAPRAPEAVEMEARVLYHEGKKADAVALLAKYHGGQEERLPGVAAVLESLGEHAAAEKLWRRLAADPKRPALLLLLARNLALQKRPADALAVCAAAWGKARDEDVAAASLRVLRSGEASARQRDEVAAKVRAALGRRKDAAGLLLSLAELEDLAGRYDEAMDLYRRVLAVQPANVAALNNLSYLLTLRGGRHEQALELVNRVLDEVGPAAEVLDTRGLVHLNAGRADRAAADFQAAVRQDPAATKYLHLAQARHAAGERVAARAALAQARAKGLKEKLLHPLELPALTSLQTELKNE